MSITETLTQLVTAAQGATFGQGHVLYIAAASAPLTIIATRSQHAQPRIMKNVVAGFKLKTEPGDGWTNLKVTTAVDQNVTLILSDDDVEQVNAVSVTGAVLTVPVGATTLNPSTTQVQATGGALSIPANASRRNITISNVTGSAGSIFAQSVGAGAGKGTEIQVGQSWSTNGTYAFDLRNDSGGNVTISVFEEQ